MPPKTHSSNLPYFSGLHYWLGIGVCPVLTWACAGLCFLFYKAVAPLITRGLLSTPYVVTSSFLLFVVFWACVAGFAGFAATFLWNEYSLDNLWGAAFGSVLLTWVPILFADVSAPLVLGLLPFLFFVGLYTWGIEKGRRFWRSHRPRQWLGDFSDLGP